MEDFNTWIVDKYVAHRGLHNKELPENSMGAFEAAVEHDYAIECDVHQIEDGTIVVFHDDTLDRLTGQDGYVNQIKSKEDLKKYKLLDSKYTIPTLQELLDMVNGRVPILIEIKSYTKPTTLESNLYELIKNYNGKCAVMSLNPYSVGWFAENAPEIPRGQLSSFFKGIKQLGFTRKFFLKRMLLNKRVSKPNFIGYHYKDVPNRYVKKYKNIPLLVWAVPSQQEYMRVAKHCDNIIFENFEPRI